MELAHLGSLGSLLNSEKGRLNRKLQHKIAVQVSDAARGPAHLIIQCTWFTLHWKGLCVIIALYAWLFYFHCTAVWSTAAVYKFLGPRPRIFKEEHSHNPPNPFTFRIDAQNCMKARLGSGADVYKFIT